MTFQHRAGVRLYTASFEFAQPCVFAKQLPGPILCASQREDPLSRSYRVSLPSSLTMNLPSALVYSTRLRVSVCGTGSIMVKLSGFSREYDYLHCQMSPRGLPYSQVSAQCVDLPAHINAYALQRGIPYPRGSSTAPSPHRPVWKSRNINRVSHRPRRSAYA